MPPAQNMHCPTNAQPPGDHPQLDAKWHVVETLGSPDILPFILRVNPGKRPADSDMSGALAMPNAAASLLKMGDTSQRLMSKRQSTAVLRSWKCPTLGWRQGWQVHMATLSQNHPGWKQG